MSSLHVLGAVALAGAAGCAAPLPADPGEAGGAAASRGEAPRERAGTSPAWQRDREPPAASIEAPSWTIAPTSAPVCLSSAAIDTLIYGSRANSDEGPYYGYGGRAFDGCHTQGAGFQGVGGHLVVTCQQNWCPGSSGQYEYGFALSYHHTGHRDDIEQFHELSPVVAGSYLPHPSSTQFMPDSPLDHASAMQFPLALAKEGDSQGHHGSRLFMMQVDDTGAMTRLGGTSVASTCTSTKTTQCDPHIGTLAYGRNASNWKYVLGCDYGCKNLYVWTWWDGFGNWQLYYGGSKPASQALVGDWPDRRDWAAYNSMMILPDCAGGRPYLIGTKADASFPYWNYIHVWRIQSDLTSASGLALENIAYREFIAEEPFFKEGVAPVPTGTDAQVRFAVFPDNWGWDSCIGCTDCSSAGHLWGYQYTFNR